MSDKNNLNALIAILLSTDPVAFSGGTRRRIAEESFKPVALGTLEPVRAEVTYQGTKTQGVSAILVENPDGGDPVRYYLGQGSKEGEYQIFTQADFEARVRENPALGGDVIWLTKKPLSGDAFKELAEHGVKIDMLPKSVEKPEPEPEQTPPPSPQAIAKVAESRIQESQPKDFHPPIVNPDKEETEGPGEQKPVENISEPRDYHPDIVEPKEQELPQKVLTGDPEKGSAYFTEMRIPFPDEPSVDFRDEGQLGNAVQVIATLIQYDGINPARLDDVIARIAEFDRFIEQNLNEPREHGDTSDISYSNFLTKIKNGENVGLEELNQIRRVRVEQASNAFRGTKPDDNDIRKKLRREHGIDLPKANGEISMQSEIKLGVAVHYLSVNIVLGAIDPSMQEEIVVELSKVEAKVSQGIENGNPEDIKPHSYADYINKMFEKSGDKSAYPETLADLQEIVNYRKSFVSDALLAQNAPRNNPENQTELAPVHQ